MVYRHLEELVCGTDQKQPLLCLGREKGSIVEVRDAYRSRTRLQPIKFLNYIENIRALEEKLCQLGIALVSLRAIDGQEVGRNQFFNNIHNPGGEEGHTMLFFERDTKGF